MVVGGALVRRPAGRASGMGVGRPLEDVLGAGETIRDFLQRRKNRSEPQGSRDIVLGIQPREQLLEPLGELLAGPTVVIVFPLGERLAHVEPPAAMLRGGAVDGVPYSVSILLR